MSPVSMPSALRFELLGKCSVLVSVVALMSALMRSGYQSTRCNPASAPWASAPPHIYACSHASIAEGPYAGSA